MYTMILVINNTCWSKLVFVGINLLLLLSSLEPDLDPMLSIYQGTLKFPSVVFHAYEPT